MTFQVVLTQTPALQGAWQPGFQALSAADRQHVDAQDTRRLAGSVNVDAALARTHPNDPRWDYAVGHRPTNYDEEVVYWIEIHPSSSGEIRAVKAKLTWLKKWLQVSAPELNAMRKAFIWVSSGRASFSPGSPRRKELALLGLRYHGRVFKIPNKAFV
ncbi:MAG: hypothetical protein ACUVS7_19710 [Bryobacteraceae bacterium]